MLILPDWLITAADETPRQFYGIRSAGGVIQDIDSNQELMARYPDELVVDAAGHTVLPGFVNAHTHLSNILTRGMPTPPGGQPADPQRFLTDYWWTHFEDRLDIDMIAAATNYVCADMLSTGTTTCFNIVQGPGAVPGVLHALKEIIEDRGLRGRLSLEATERVGDDMAQKALAENAELLDQCSRDAGEPGRLPLVDGIVSWQGTATCSKDYIVQAAALAKDRGVLTQAHCNEGPYEGEQALANHGKRPVELYDELGVAGSNFLASGCVELSDLERAVLADREVRVVHTPLSNGSVAAGIAPIPEMAEAGVTIGLGSDGYVNDFFEVMRGAYLIHKARLQDNQVMPAEQVLAMATEGGAKVLGLDKIGRLAVGWAADVQVVDTNLPTTITEDNLIEQLVLWRGGHHVRDVLVAGRWRVRNHEVLDSDLERLKAKTREQASRLWETC